MGSEMCIRDRLWLITYGAIQGSVNQTLCNTLCSESFFVGDNFYELSRTNSTAKSSLFKQDCRMIRSTIFGTFLGSFNCVINEKGVVTEARF